MNTHPRLALVLAGGGARGAYEAGVLRFILRDLPKKIGRPIAADLICGTSVGGINGSYIAARNGDPDGADELSKFWTELTVPRVYRFEALDLLRSPMRLFRGPARDHLGAVDASPLHDLIRNEFPFEQLRDTIDSGRLHALVLTATEVVSGQSVQFIDGQVSENEHAGGGRTHQIRTNISSDHILATCAIPFLFPPIEIDGRSLVDGSLRQNTPLSPALHLNAQATIVIGTKRPRTPMDRGVGDENVDPTPAFLMGKALNALLLDPVHADIERIEFVNQILAWGTQEYGSDFTDKLNQQMIEKIGRPLRQVEVLSIHPSEDLGRIAAAVWNPQEIEGSRSSRMLLSAVADRGSSGEADLLSYLLFDQSYTRVIERLGYDDAQAQETRIIRFLESVFTASDS